MSCISKLYKFFVVTMKTIQMLSFLIINIEIKNNNKSHEETTKSGPYVADYAAYTRGNAFIDMQLMTIDGKKRSNQSYKNII